MDAPGWFFARNTSTTLKADHFTFFGCRHANEFAAPRAIIPATERADKERRWDIFAEVLFEEYTTPRPWTEAMCAEWRAKNPDQPLPERSTGWTNEQRERFRERLWPTPQPIVPSVLFDRENQPTAPADIAAVRAWNDAHPASEEESSYF
jgi:hypothetical protein